MHRIGLKELGEITDNTGAETFRSFMTDDGGLGDIKVTGLSVAPNNDLYITENAQHRVLKLSGGVLSVVAGGGLDDSDGTGTAAKFWQSFRYSPWKWNTLFIADRNKP